MIEEQHPVAPTNTNKDTLIQATDHLASSRIPRNILIGVGIAIVLTCIEGALWILNPFHLFGSGTPHSISTLLSIPVHTPLVLLILLLQVIIVYILVQIADRPLSLLRYIRDVQKAQEQYRTLYTPLASWKEIYETSITRYQDTPDLSTPGQVQNISMMELAHDMEVPHPGTPSHQLILGEPGAGKTIFLYVYRYMALRQPRSLVFGHDKIPIYIPLRDYSLYLETHDAGSPQEKHSAGTQSLLDFLYTSDLSGMHHLTPFLQKLVAQGRVLFLCDGLNEIDEKYRAIVSMELAGMLGQSQNQLVLTCREVDYLEQPELAQAVEENLVVRVYINPLDAEQMRSFVERFIGERDSGKKWQLTAGQVMEVINRSRLHDHCTNPLMFFSLLEIIDGIGVNFGRQLDTRGRLLRAYVKDLIQYEMSQPRWSNAALDENDVVLFLSEIAYAARWTNTVNTIQLPVSRREKALRTEELAVRLQTWLSEHPAKSLVALQAVEMPSMALPDAQEGINQALTNTLQNSYSRQELARLLQFAQSAALIEISPGGIVSFCHELFAAYFVAEYFVAQGLSARKRIGAPGAEDVMNLAHTEGSLIWEIGTQFITPIALWAGLLEDPVDYAKRFAVLGQQNPAFNLEALTLSLVCLGIAHIPPQADNAHQLVVPSNLKEAVTLVVQDAQVCDALARLFTHYAVEGAQEIYQSLFPLLMVNGIDEFVIRLNAGIVLDLFFKHLCDVVDNAAYETVVKRLVRVLGRFGAVAVPFAAELSQSSPGRSGRLRSATINILGGTDQLSAVEPLILLLRDANRSIVERAANALIRLGPEHSFNGLVQEMEDRTPASARQQVHWAVLHILGRFLNEPDAARQLTPSQLVRLVTVLLHVVISNYAPEDQQKAREMLVKQARNAGVSVAGEKAVELLVQNLSSGDETVARATIKTLKEIGSPATPYLLGQMKPQAPEVMRSRIIEVLADVRDPRALPYLLRCLDDSALVVQQQIAAALRTFAPESIPGLIDCVLHSDSEPVATRAERILGDIGEESLTPVIQALTPVVPGRTHLLVQVLERIHNPQAIPALIALLETPHRASLPTSNSLHDSSFPSPAVEQTLQVAIVHALGQFPDERVVAPLLDMLASSNPLIYEGAINALGYLEDVSMDGLIAALNGDSLREDEGREVERQTVITSRIERAILGMIHFPGQRLLEALSQGSDTQAQHIINIFLAKGAEAAQILVGYLFHPNMHLQNYIRFILGEMNGQVIVPALLEVLNHPEPTWRVVIAELLLKHPREAIPPLVGLLDDDERGAAAEILLLEFGPVALPYLVPGLDALNNRAQERSRRIVVKLVQQVPELVQEVVQLFNLSPPPPQRAYETLLDLLTNELVDSSVPALLEGLEDAHLIDAVSKALVRLVKKDDSRSEMVQNELLAALRMEQRRHGAGYTLVEIGEKVVPAVGNLITDPDTMVAQAAQNILCEIGIPAFSFIWAAQSDTSNLDRRTAARSIFRRMHTTVVKDELVRLLMSNESDDISMALALLLERINDEALLANGEHEMIPALLEHVQTHSDEQTNLRIIALLLLLGGGTVVDYITQALYDFPNHQHLLVYAFLLLGEEGEEVLLEILHDPEATATLRAEAAGLLGLLAPNVDIREYARMLGEYGLWAGQSVGKTGVLHAERLAISLHALGGLLAGGHWNATELQNLRLHSQDRSAEHELYNVLLGWRYSPQITMLENDLQAEQEQHKKNVLKFTQEILRMRTDIVDVEQQLEQLHNEHGMRGEDLELANKKIEDLQHTLNLATQEKQSIQDTLLQTTQEKKVLQAQVDRWRQYAEQLESGLDNPQSPKKN